jgi:hypothetical protein
MTGRKRRRRKTSSHFFLMTFSHSSHNLLTFFSPPSHILLISLSTGPKKFSLRALKSKREVVDKKEWSQERVMGVFVNCRLEVLVFALHSYRTYAFFPIPKNHQIDHGGKVLFEAPTMAQTVYRPLKRAL